MDPLDRIPALLDRLTRVAAAGTWSEALNPAQRAALGYLARANRFSRAPSQVADWLCTTRGTASQTLKALEAKGLVARDPDARDRRSVAFAVTPAGHAALDARGGLRPALDRLAPADRDAIARALAALLDAALAAGGYRGFGQCRTCRHHAVTPSGRRCALLDADLAPSEADQICHEFAA